MNKEKIKNNRVVRHLYYFASGVLKRSKLKRSAEKTLNQFGRSFETERDKQRFINDMVKTYAYYGFGFDEFLYFNFDKKSKSERLSFVADWEHLGYACTLNSPKNNDLFDNKFKTYRTFERFYRRNVLFFDDEAQYSSG